MSPTHLDAARDLYDLVDAGAAEAGDAPVPRATVDALVAAGLHAVNSPREVGGAELTLPECVDVFTEISRADGSAGWSLMASATTAAFFGAYGADEFVEKMFANGVPLAAGQFAPNGTARRDGTDWIVNGDYQFASGIDVAEWVGAGTITEPAEGEDAEILFTVFPVGQAERRGNWDVLGLRATASEDYAVRDVRVPDGAAFPFFAPTRRRGGPIYELGVLGLVTVGHAGFALGVVRRAVEELRVVAATKHRLGAASPLRDSERFLHDFAVLEMRARANELLTRDQFAHAQTVIESTGAPDPAVSNALRATTVRITQDGADIVRGCYLLAGTSGLRAGPLERCFRDIHAGTQHFFAGQSGLIDFARDQLEA